MKKNTTSLRDEQEPLFLVPGKKGIDWNASKGNFIHLAKIAYSISVAQCEKYVINDDMRDPDAMIDEALRDNMDPIVNILKHYEEHGLPYSIAEEIRNCDWLRMTRNDVVKALSPEAQKMRKRKLALRKQRDERKKNGNTVIID